MTNKSSLDIQCAVYIIYLKIFQGRVAFPEVD